MAGNGSRRGGGDRVLESRHLMALFLGVVLLCCVFFTLGYVMGNTQYVNSPVQAASIEKTAQPHPSSGAKAAAPPPASQEWDFYTEKKTTDVPLKPAPPASSRRVESVSAPATRAVALPRARLAFAVPGRFRPPRMSRNAIVLQVGALRSESDALTMARALQKRGFPAFIVTPTTDSFYRVQVGPFATQAIGDQAKKSLERKGLRAIFRR